MKTCPVCGEEWAPKFKFCPEDGTLLPPDAAAAPAPTAAPAARTSFPVTSPSARPKPANQRLLNLEPAPAADELPAPAKPASRAAKRPKTGTFEMPEPSVRPQRLVRDANAPSRAEGARSEAPSAEDDAPRRARTVMMDAAAQQPEAMTSPTRVVSRPPSGPRARPVRAERAIAPVDPTEPFDLGEAPPAKGKAGKPAAKAAAPKPEKPAEKAKPPAKKKREFSETSWFMNAPDPELADPETGKVKRSTKDYKPDETVEESKRKQFSLRRDNEE